jgi:phenylalanine-4-hydroxylase
VNLDRDHPGFRDLEYRERRDTIARIALDYVPGTPVPDAGYSSEEDGLWETITDALQTHHERFACREYLDAKATLEIAHSRVPQLQSTSERLSRRSGFRLEPVAGLVEASAFLGALADGTLLSTQYIRHHSSPFYTPEPDIVHEVMGHAVTLVDERLAFLNRLFGRAAIAAPNESAREELSKVYWFTIEFGLVNEAAGPKAIGAGLVSSVGEMSAIEKAEIVPFDIDMMIRQTIDPTNFQPVLFCAESFHQMYNSLVDYLA